MYFIQNLNKKQRSKLKKVVLLLVIILLFFLVIYIREMLLRRTIISDYDGISEYDLFIPDKSLFHQMAQEQIMNGTLKGYQDIPEEIDKAAYEVFSNIIREFDKKFECRIICFNQVYVGGKKNDYIIYTYDRSIGDSFLNMDFFQVKKGRLFKGKKNELVIVKGKKNRIGREIIYNSSDGLEYKFPVVGRLKRSYIPIGSMFTEKVSCQVMDSRANKKTIYLLNPDSEFCKSRDVKGSVSIMYIKFKDEDALKGKEYLEKYGIVTKMELK